MQVSASGTVDDNKLNSNIRCIEMQVSASGTVDDNKLNSNIRCIEIDIGVLKALLGSG